MDSKIFWLNNGGYHSIRQTQRNFFGSLVGCGPESGLGFPEASRLALAYELPYFCLTDHDQMKSLLPQVLNTPGPVICEVMLNPKQEFSPKVSSKRLPDGRMVSRPLEDLAPFLSDEELAQNMLIPMVAKE